MRYIFKLIAITLMTTVVLAACSGDDKGSGSESSDTPLQVITTFTLLEDIVKQIGGDRVEIHNLVPIGTDPHEYDPLPEDMAIAEDADLLFYNGLNLEGGDTGWFSKLVDTVGQKEEAIFELGEGLEPLYLTSSEGEEEVNSHSFLDPNVGIKMAENTRDALIKVDPDHKEDYEKNATAYLDTLKEIDEEYRNKIGEIPEENRILVTSERAYQYMATSYGLNEAFIWAVDTEEGGTPEQITSLITFINENNPPVLFVESNVDTRPMETVSKETGVEIFSEDLFSDEIGSPGEEGDTYVKYLQYNIDKIYEGLSK